MKLPSSQQYGVQSLGRQDINAPARKFQSKAVSNAAIGNAIGAASELGEKILDVRNKYDLSQADTMVIQTMSELESKYAGATEIDANDPVLKGVSYKKTDEWGKKRKTIPQHEVYGQLYEKRAKDALDNGGKLIRNKKVQTNWSTEYQNKAAENIAKVQSQTMKAEYNYTVDRQRGLVDNMFELGQYGAALNLLNNGNWVGSELEADNLKIKARAGQENTDTATAINSGSVNEILKRAEQLEDTANFSMATPDETRLKEATRLKKVAKIQSENNATQTAHIMYLDMKQKNYSDEQIRNTFKSHPDAAISKAGAATARQNISDREADETRYKDDLYEGFMANKTPKSAIPAKEWEMLDENQRASIVAKQSKALEDIEPSVAQDNKVILLQLNDLLYNGTDEQITDALSRTYPNTSKSANSATQTKLDSWATSAREKLQGVEIEAGATVVNDVKKRSRYEISGDVSLSKANSSDTTKILSFERRYDAELEQYKSENDGKMPDSTWLNNKADELMNATYLEEGAVYGYNEEPLYMLDVDGIDPVKLDGYVAYLKSEGVPATKENILELEQYMLGNN